MPSLRVRFPFAALPFLTALAGAAPLAAQTGDAAAPPAAVDSTFVAQEKPTLDVRRTAGPIVIDGDLSDAGWQGAARATDFSENSPRERTRPPVDSEVWVAYDDENLYLAFVARDDDPSRIRTSIADRDQMWQDDYFGILLDTYGDASWAYFLFANPAGVQGDSRFASALGEDDGFDIVYESEGRVTAEGYQVEMAIPFGSLRFPDRPEQTWRATFWRTRPREARATYTWAATSRDEPCFLCTFGTLTGIRGVEPGGALELLPAVVASHVSSLGDDDDPQGGLESGDFDAEASLTARYAHPGGITLEATVNPDFSQVESDVAEIDVNSTFALFFPERRPFFQEGSDLFDTWVNVVYTRQINDPTAAAKLIYRTGRTTLAYLGARDERSPILLPFLERSFVGVGEESVSNILRGRRTYGENSYAAVIFADRRFEDGGGSGTNYGVDGLHRFSDNLQLEWQAVGSRTVEPDEAGATDDLGDLTFDDGKHTGRFDGEKFSGFAQYASLERDARRWNFDFDYWGSSPAFRADDGFETRNDFRQASMFQGLNFWTDDSKWTRFLAPAVFVQKNWSYDGDSRYDLYSAWLDVQFTKQTFSFIRYNREREVFRDLEFDDMSSWEFLVDSDFYEPFRFFAYGRVGESIARNQDVPVIGDGMDLEIGATIKPIDRLTIEPSVNWSELSDPHTDEEFFSGYVFRTRANYNFSRRLFMRMVVQYNDFSEQLNVEPLLTYRINPFTLFYVGSTQVWEDFAEQDVFAETSRQFFLKFQYLFRS